MDNNNLEQLKSQYGQQKPQKSKKKWLPIVVSIVIILIIAAIAVGILSLLKLKPSATTTTTATPTPTVVTAGPVATDVIDKIAANTTIAGLKNYTELRSNPTEQGISPDTTTLAINQAGYSFITNVAPDDSLQFTLTDTNGASSKSTVTAAIKQTLIDNGFTQTAQDVSALSVYTTMTYRNDGTVCQIIDFANGDLEGQEQSVLCATGATIGASYANVKDLLQKADSSLPATAKTVIQKLVTNDTKKLITLTVKTGTSSTANNYYFATLDTSYAYLGTKPTPSVDNASSYTIPEALKKNISDPKWGTFLTDNIR